MRTCKVCKEKKTQEDFYISKKGKLSSYCKPCEKERMIKWREKNPKYSRQYQLKKWYNLDEDSFLILYEKQKGCCAICNKERRLVVDHCHDTGRVRGLLCYGCNTSLGVFDDGKLLDKAKEYVSYQK